MVSPIQNPKLQNQDFVLPMDDGKRRDSSNRYSGIEGPQQLEKRKPPRSKEQSMQWLTEQ